MLQSAIQALEVQRATLRAFAQTSVEGVQNAAVAEKPKSAGWPMSGAARPEAPPAPEAAATPKPNEAAPESGDEQQSAATPPGFDPGPWWNMLQSQFNQLAHLAMLQPGMTGMATQPTGAVGGAAASPDVGDTGTDMSESAAAKKAPARMSAPRKKAP